MYKIKVLAVAPYEELKNLIMDCAHQKEELEIECFVSDMLEGVKLVKSMQNKKGKNYNIIMSRAGTAELIREITATPVVDIKLSVVDMMGSIRLAQNYSGKFAIVGFKTITDSARLICELLQQNIEIQTIETIADIDTCLSSLKQKGISLIVGDVITTTHSKKIGLNTILVTSGRKSVINSLDEAIRIYKTTMKVQQNNTFINAILEGLDSSIVSYDLNKKIIYSGFKNTINIDLLDKLEGLIDILIEEKKLELIEKIDNSIVKIKGKLLKMNGSSYPTFYIEYRTSIEAFEKRIYYTNVFDTPEVNFETFNTTNFLMKKVIRDAKNYAKLESPIMVYGDKGTEKTSIVHTIYTNSLYHNNPLIVIDSKYMDEKKWSKLFQSQNSVFTNINYTFYIKNLHLMTKKSQIIFEFYIKDISLYTKNKFIFSCIPGYSESFDKSDLLHFIKNKLNTLPILMPSLNEKKEDIPSLASIYLNNLNIKHGKQIIGFEKEAMEILQEHNWIGNVDQLRRVIEQIILLTSSLYIKKETVQKILSYEILPKFHYNKGSIDLDKPLEEIIKDIINIVLKKENYNQSKTAAKLGISRSTLWRKIK